MDENLRLGLAGRRTRDGADEDLARVYELFPVVEESLRRKAGTLSGGQQQQLAIARALVADPEVLLLDEPSLGLAPRMVNVVFETLAAIRDRGLAVLLVEQRAQRTVALADRSHVLANGQQRLTLGPESRRTPPRSSARTWHDRRPPQHRLADARRRDRAWRDLRTHGRRDRARVRRAAARELRVRAARDGRRLCARVRLGARLAGLGRHRAVLRRRPRALAADGPDRLQAAARPDACRDARHDLRSRLPAPEHRAALVRTARQDRLVACDAQPAGHHLRRQHPQDRDRCDRACRLLLLALVLLLERTRWACTCGRRRWTSAPQSSSVCARAV